MNEVLSMLSTLEDRFFSNMSNFTKQYKGMLPYDVEQNSDTGEVTISIAAAGYSALDLNVEFKDGVLEVSGSQNSKPKNSEKWTWIYKGISQRDFKFLFPVSSSYEVKNASFVNGLLSITLNKSEEQKGKKIPIN